MSGFVVGGIMFGVLGFVFAPQLSRALLGEDQRLRLPRFMEEEEADPEVTRQTLAEKIAQLNDAIDDVSSQLRAQGQESDEAAA
jgi:gas vesicle protein